MKKVITTVKMNLDNSQVTPLKVKEVISNWWEEFTLTLDGNELVIIDENDYIAEMDLSIYQSDLLEALNDLEEFNVEFTITEKTKNLEKCWRCETVENEVLLPDENALDESAYICECCNDDMYQR